MSRPVSDEQFDEWDEEDPRVWSDADEVIEPYCDLESVEVCESCT